LRSIRRKDKRRHHPQTGFLTTYTYDVLGDMIGVSQNAQPGASATQTRTYTFDMAGRMLTEANPESGTTTYVYDTESSACGSITSPGDLVLKTDANGNITCYYHDALHRLVHESTVAGSGPNPTPERFFVYDSATVNGVAMVNAKGRLAEAYTCNTCTGAHLTDEGFSYSARGQVTDVYESTPNSGGYYHVNATYWANGSLDVLNGGTGPLAGLPAITYGASDGTGLDSEGRITKVNAATGQNPVTTVGYNVAQQVTGVTFGSADSDVYQYDGNTGRMTNYTFKMGTTPLTDVGALNWNANGTLQTLQITDQINTANSQTCTFGYDDLVRITSANCGTPWSQTFGLDPFGNLTKSGSASFQPIYNLAKNQYSSIPGGSSTAYDTNGNLTNDVTHSYTWDADANMLSTDGSTVTMIYDALDRMIEQTRGSAHTQIVYGPYGLKLALMNGQTLVNAFVKLPGGARAVYSSTGLAYYRHADHLGSSRLSTTPTRTKYYDVAYAPYGEDYDGSGTTPDLAFTDQNQDTVKGGWSTNVYDFIFREYRTAHGRWTSPDPAGLAAVNPASPQSWNRYAYVENNPLVYVDPDGTTTWDTNCLLCFDFPYGDLPGSADIGGPGGPTTDDEVIIAMGGGGPPYPYACDLFGCYVPVQFYINIDPYGLGYGNPPKAPINQNNPIANNGAAKKPGLDTSPKAIKCTLSGIGTMLIDYAGFIPGEGVVHALFGIGLGVVGAGNSAVNEDTTGVLGSVAGLHLSALELTGSTAIPVFGTILNGALTVHDYNNIPEDYARCMGGGD
jgi:RHS repeat-associated protein